MTRRIIFHADCNNFFASCECLMRPELRDVPMAVAGDPERRTGVVVAKNELAKKYGVKTTDTVYAAKKKCPGIVFVPPQHALYHRVSQKINQLYLTYTDYVEPASIDESFLDMTEAPDYYHKTPRELADELRRRVREEIGVTISVGVSFCKVFAKMGSDYKKPDATTVITEDTYRDIIWPLPVGDLPGVGHAAMKTLKRRSIDTVGDLALCGQDDMRAMLGKQGVSLWQSANGLDDQPVRRYGDDPPVKSVSRGHTFPHDLICEDDVRAGLGALVDEVARTLRRQKLTGSVVWVQIRRPDMGVVSRQVKLRHSTCLQHEIYATALELVQSNWRIGPQSPIRALTVGVGGLAPADEAVEQLTIDALLAPDRAGTARQRQERLEAAVDALRLKHGDNSITLGFRPDEISPAPEGGAGAEHDKSGGKGIL